MNSGKSTTAEETIPFVNRIIQFENQALAILKGNAIDDGKLFFSSHELPRQLERADAIAPDGILDLPGPCVVEVKYNLSSANLDFVESRIKKLPVRIASIIFVCHNIIGSRQKLGNKLQAMLPGVQIRVINKEELDSLSSSARSSEILSPSNFDSIIDSVKRNESPSATKSINADKQHKRSLINAYNDDKLALFLGAGVSKSAKLPDWSDLVRSVTAKVLDKQSGAQLSDSEKEEVQDFFKLELPSSPLIVARLLQNALGDSFMSDVRDALYDGVDENASSDLLREITALCMPRRSGIGVVGVVNYNFDDLLEKELEAKGISCCSIMGEGVKSTRNELPIYHVHGYLPRNVSLDETHRQSLVLSEDAYHLQFTDPFIWTNITQLNLLRNNVCLFIGISFTDPNHRRLLEITANKVPGASHYAILVNHWQGAAAKKLSEKAQALSLVFKQLEESSFHSLGISIIWVKNFDEIPQVVREIRTGVTAP